MGGCRGCGRLEKLWRHLVRVVVETGRLSACHNGSVVADLVAMLLVLAVLVSRREHRWSRGINEAPSNPCRTRPQILPQDDAID